MTNHARIAAIFDVDGTLIAGNSMERSFIRFLWRRGELKWTEFLRFFDGALESFFAGRSPISDNKAYLRGKDAAHVRKLAREFFEEEVVSRLLPQATDRLRWHQNSGHFVILLSGTLDLLLEPLAEHLGVSARVGAELEVENRRFTGRIAGLPPSGKAKANCLSVMSRIGILDLKRSFAYADRYTDRFLLAEVGYPVATNADIGLRRVADSRGWMIEDFVPHGTTASRTEAWL